jgi:hypothetical protein
MPALFVFLLKVNIALIIFCLGYYLVLRKLTFYTLNRVYLGLGIIFSSIYPLINLTDFLQRHQQIAKPMQQVVLNWKSPRAIYTAAGLLAMGHNYILVGCHSFCCAIIGTAILII